jgi:hypothetical protein
MNPIAGMVSSSGRTGMSSGWVSLCQSRRRGAAGRRHSASTGRTAGAYNRETFSVVRRGRYTFLSYESCWIGGRLVKKPEIRYIPLWRLISS